MKTILRVEALECRAVPTVGLLGTIQGIAASPEAVTSAAPVPQAYQVLLHRPADADGLAFWQGKVAAGEPLGQVDGEIASCPEFSAVNVTARAQVDALYLGILGRPADDAGESFWITNVGGDGQHATTAYTLVTPPGSEPLTVQVPANLTVYGVNKLGIPQIEVTQNLAPADQFAAASYDVTFNGAWSALPAQTMSGADARAFDSFIPDALKTDVSYTPIVS